MGHTMISIQHRLLVPLTKTAVGCMTGDVTIEDAWNSAMCKERKSNIPTMDPASTGKVISNTLTNLTSMVITCLDCFVWYFNNFF